MKKPFRINKWAKRGVFALLLSAFLSLAANAQAPKTSITAADYSNTEAAMADIMRANGKIYVVIGVVGIIFAGMLLFMVRMDKKISSLEKELEN